MECLLQLLRLHERAGLLPELNAVLPESSLEPGQRLDFHAVEDLYPGLPATVPNVDVRVPVSLAAMPRTGAKTTSMQESIAILQRNSLCNQLILNQDV